MAVYVLLQVDDEAQAKTLVGDIINNPDSDLLTPAQENNVRAQVRAVFKKPTMFCNCGADGKKISRDGGGTRGRKYGWWVHARCGKPKLPWAEGSQWYALGTNLLPLALMERLGHPDEHRPQGWKSPQSWTFLLDEEECDWDYRHDGKWCYDHNRPLEVCRRER